MSHNEVSCEISIINYQLLIINYQFRLIIEKTLKEGIIANLLSFVRIRGKRKGKKNDVRS
ncbi:MAG: hypothetical protein DRR16_24565 [Candidatus Parabeggiatoa sp. nov. 3]|nr:MAG: hypothetical protein DRQ99_01825 [Gammaproteobacteria bacterium]RKZ80047.1 MAG: hypothetical protein DRR16_24565 [Gammaproteobacteria bacterium]